MIANYLKMLAPVLKAVLTLTIFHPALRARMTDKNEDSPLRLRLLRWLHALPPFSFLHI